MTRVDLPSWIIIAPVEHARLERAVAAVRAQRFGGLDEDEAPAWGLVAAPSPKRSALYSREAGAVGEELEVAAELVRRLGVAATSLALEGYEDGAFLARVHEPGGRYRDLREDPLEILRREGFEALTAPAEEAPLRSVLIIEGLTPEAAAEALELRPGGKVKAERTARGTLVTSPSHDAGDLQDLLPSGFGHISYSVMWDPPRFAVFMATPDGRLSAFERPAAETELPQLEEVCGEREPAAILRALGVPLAELDFPLDAPRGR